MAKQDGEAQTKQGQTHPAKSSSEQSEQGQEGSSNSKEKEQQGSGKKEQGKKKCGGKSKQDEGDHKSEQKQKPQRVEWIVGTACALLVLSAVGYLFYRALSGPELPPMVTVRTERILPMGGGGYLVEFKAVNEGSGTAANLMVEGALMRDTAVVEKSTATVQFVPAETERGGGLFFTKDPRRYRLEVRPTGFDRP